MRLLLIVNPVSGKGMAGARARALRRALEGATDVEAEVEVVETSARGQAAEVVRSRAPDLDRVVAVGGDGTLNEVLGGVMAAGGSAAARPALGFLPAGTANVAAPALGFAREPARAALALLTPDPRTVDVGVAAGPDVAAGSAGERAFLLWLGAGYDAVSIEALNATRTGTMGVARLARLAPRVWTALRRYPAPPVRWSVDGERSGEAPSVLAANVGRIAFGGSLTDAADPTDGRLDVLAVRVPSTASLVPLMARMLGPGLDSSRRVSHTAGRALTLEADARVPVQVDGEPAGTLPLTVRVIPGAVRLLTSAGDTRP